MLENPATVPAPTAPQVVHVQSIEDGPHPLDVPSKKKSHIYQGSWRVINGMVVSAQRLTREEMDEYFN